MYAGGQLVQPSADGSRPGYAENLPNNVYKNKQGNYVYRSGSGEDRVYKSGFKTPDAASKWGQKEFVKKFSLPNKFVNAGELGEILGISKKIEKGFIVPPVRYNKKLSCNISIIKKYIDTFSGNSILLKKNIKTKLLKTPKKTTKFAIIKSNSKSNMNFTILIVINCPKIAIHLKFTYVDFFRK